MIISFIISSPYLNTRIILLIGALILSLTWIIEGGKSYIFKWTKEKNPKIFIISLIQYVGFLPQILGVRFLPFPKSSFESVFNILGTIIFYAGIFIAVWGRINMGRTWGMPGTWDTKRDKKLVTHGAFKYSRNPIYLGFLLLFFGLELALNSLLVFGIILLYFYFNWEIGKEEKILEREFGKDYLEYKRTVKRLIWSR